MASHHLLLSPSPVGCFSGEFVFSMAVVLLFFVLFCFVVFPLCSWCSAVIFGGSFDDGGPCSADEFVLFPVARDLFWFTWMVLFGSRWRLVVRW
jgi:hypothetical protein